MKVAIIGAGLAGLSAARALRQRGVSAITVFERRSGPGLETSFANGALLHPSLPEPWNSPGIAWELLRHLGHEDAAALLRLRALPSLLGWGVRFLRESSPACYARNARANLRLARYSAMQMQRVRSEGIAYSHHATGSLMLFREAPALHQARRWAQDLSDAGRRFEAWSIDQAVQAEPALAPIAKDIVGALFNPDDERGDAWLYCQALSEHLSRDGVQLRYGCTVSELTMRGPSVSGLRCIGPEGREEQLDFDAVVLAAASHCVDLGRAAGLDIPVRPAKGYSLTLQPPDATVLPRLAVVDATLHVAVVPVGEDRLRIAGTAEFTGMNLQLNPRRLANLSRLLRRVYPQVAALTPQERITPWTGLRPMVPDGVPLIGPTRVKGLYLNTGHGHLGWTLAAGSAQLLVDLMQGRTPAVSPQAYAPSRFGL